MGSTLVLLRERLRSLDYHGQVNKQLEKFLNAMLAGKILVMISKREGLIYREMWFIAEPSANLKDVVAKGKFTIEP